MKSAKYLLILVLQVPFCIIISLLYFGFDQNVQCKDVNF